MSKKLTKLFAAFGLMGLSAAAWASEACCGDLACCLERLACCLN